MDYFIFVPLGFILTCIFVVLLFVFLYAAAPYIILFGIVILFTVLIDKTRKNKEGNESL